MKLVKKNLFLDLNDGCVDLRENCTFYATKYDGYCEYNKDYMEIYCPFSCGYCGKFKRGRQRTPYMTKKT